MLLCNRIFFFKYLQRSTTETPGGQTGNEQRLAISAILPQVPHRQWSRMLQFAKSDIVHTTRSGLITFHTYLDQQQRHLAVKKGMSNAFPLPQVPHRQRSCMLQFASLIVRGRKGCLYRHAECIIRLPKMGAHSPHVHVKGRSGSFKKTGYFCYAITDLLSVVG